MLKILKYDSTKGCAGPVRETVCEILADTEADITGIGETVYDPDACLWDIKPLPGSMAATADGTAAYVMAPSGGWVKIGG